MKAKLKIIGRVTTLPISEYYPAKTYDVQQVLEFKGITMYVTTTKIDDPRKDEWLVISGYAAGEYTEL